MKLRFIISTIGISSHTCLYSKIQGHLNSCPTGFLLCKPGSWCKLMKKQMPCSYNILLILSLDFNSFPALYSSPLYSDFLISSLTCLKTNIKTIVYLKHFQAFKPLWRQVHGVALPNKLNKGHGQISPPRSAFVSHFISYFTLFICSDVFQLIHSNQFYCFL